MKPGCPCLAWLTAALDRRRLDARLERTFKGVRGRCFDPDRMDVPSRRAFIDRVKRGSLKEPRYRAAYDEAREKVRGSRSAPR